MEVENCASTIETQSLTRINGRYYPFPYGTPNAILSALRVPLWVLRCTEH